MWTTLIAVAGTLLGSVSMHIMQTRAAHQRQRKDTVLHTVSNLAAALAEMRGLQDDRWLLRHTVPSGTDYRADHAYATARTAALKARTTASGHLFALRALTTHRQILALVDQLVDVTFNLHDAMDQDDLNARHQHARHVHDSLATAVGTLTR